MVGVSFGFILAYGLVIGGEPVSNELLDYVQTEAYWNSRQVSMSDEDLIKRISAAGKPGDISVTLERYRNGEESFGLWLWGPDFLDPLDRTAFMPGGTVGLRVNWSDDRASSELVELVRQARVATAPPVREQIFTDIQQRMLDESPFAFLVQSGSQVAYNAALQNFTYTSALWRIDPYTMSK